jgi:hypothetical protein
LSPDELGSVVDAYKAGMPTTGIARSFGVSGTQVINVLKRSGVPLRNASEAKRRHSWDAAAFDTVTPASAYWIGFLMADGCVRDRCVDLALKDNDRDHVERFKAFLGASHPVRTRLQPKSRGRSHELYASRITVTCPRLVAALARHGVVPRKSLTARTSDEMTGNRDFWRGVIDGDGCWYWRATKSGIKPAFILAGSEALLGQFAAFVERYLPSAPVHVFPQRLSRAWKATMNGRYACALARLLYAPGDVALPRKYAVARAMSHLA